ncbi:putative ABC transporter permease [Thermobrachium celere]|uniref:Similar to membrane protein n=1 Tax=Thermobrachium celere DSM 8682 TaxID=941824 RepID=R7RS97_9CLOT|nr:putative ABC transporter permease [Thermobrachium celere]CDF58266.1 similar to membrane protein [Thermobrachium celere DSM 8682]
MERYHYLFLCFIFYSFLGWIIEVLYHIYKDKRFINRGFLYGPICPIYGFSAVILIITLGKYKNPLLIFIIGSLIASIIEYITGYLLELFFHTKWWDYSNEKYNIKGYICLKFSIYWGAFSLVFIKLIHPNVSKIITTINQKYGEIVYNIILVIFIMDTLYTINSLIELKSIFIELKEILDEIKNTIEMRNEMIKLENNLEGRIENLIYLKNKILNRLSFKQKLLIKSYPKIKSIKFENELQHVIQHIKEKF